MYVGLKLDRHSFVNVVMLLDMGEQFVVPAIITGIEMVPGVVKQFTLEILLFQQNIVVMFMAMVWFFVESISLNKLHLLCQKKNKR